MSVVRSFFLGSSVQVEAMYWEQEKGERCGRFFLLFCGEPAEYPNQTNDAEVSKTLFQIS
jgi:hypothetical protein